MNLKTLPTVGTLYRISYTNFGQLWGLIKGKPTLASKLGFTWHPIVDSFIRTNRIELIEEKDLFQDA